MNASSKSVIEVVTRASLTGTKFPHEDGNKNQNFFHSCVPLVLFFVAVVGVFLFLFLSLL